MTPGIPAAMLAAPQSVRRSRRSSRRRSRRQAIAAAHNTGIGGRKPEGRAATRIGTIQKNPTNSSQRRKRDESGDDAANGRSDQ